MSAVSNHQELNFIRATQLLHAERNNTSKNNPNVKEAKLLLFENIFKPEYISNPKMPAAALTDRMLTNPHLKSMTLFAKCIKGESERMEYQLLKFASDNNEPTASWALGRKWSDEQALTKLAFYQKALNDGIEEPIKTELQRDFQRVSQIYHRGLILLANAADQQAPVPTLD